MKYDHESYWPRVKEFAETGNYSSIEDMILQLPDYKEQIALYRFSARSLMFRPWNNKNLRPIIQLGDKAIAQALQIGEIDEANIMNYNMSANLADCWDDGMERGRGHFQRGLQYAERAIEFRKQLKKSALSFSIAYWAHGAHHYFLEDFVAAENSFKLSLQSAMEDAKATGQSADLTKNSSYYVLLSYGYLSLAQMAQGKLAAADVFQKVMSCFEGMKEISEEAKTSATIGIEQLQYVFSKLN